MPHKTRINLSVSVSIVGLLRESGNRSGYVSSVVAQRWVDWHAALEYLRASGWHPSEIKAACDVLNGCWMIPQYGMPLGSRLAAEIDGGQRISGDAGTRDVDPERWASIVRALRSDSEIARALYAVVIEYWAGSEACERALETAGVDHD